MLDKGQIREIVYRAIDQVNELLLDEDVLSKEEGTVIVGEGAKLDSMGFVNFIVALEDEFAKAVGLEVNFIEDLSPQDSDSPQWSTVLELIDYVFLVAQTKEIERGMDR